MAPKHSKLVIEKDPTLRKRLDCRDCINANMQNRYVLLGDNTWVTRRL